MTSLPSIAIIGPGKVGMAIALAAQQNGYPIAAVAGRDSKKTEEAASFLLGNIKICEPMQAAKAAQIVFLTVPDDAIESICVELSKNNVFIAGQIVVHCSGVSGSEILAAARDMCGAEIASVHPLQTFSTIHSAINAMPGTFWFCEGTEEALKTLTQLIHHINGIPKQISSDNKVLYHCAAAIACNYLVSLIDVALTVAENADLDRDLMWKALTPLVNATINNITIHGTVGALTGPIARGDVSTVVKHLRALPDMNPKISDIYKVLGQWTAQMAVQKGLSKKQAEALSVVLGK